MNSQPFHQWITRKYGFFSRQCRKYPTLVHLRFPQGKISLTRNLLIKHLILSFQARVNTRFTPTNARKHTSDLVLCQFLIDGAFGHQGAFFCQRWQVLVPGESGSMKNILRHNTNSNRLPALRGPCPSMFVRSSKAKYSPMGLDRQMLFL